MVLELLSPESKLMALPNPPRHRQEGLEMPGLLSNAGIPEHGGWVGVRWGGGQHTHLLCLCGSTWAN